MSGFAKTLVAVAVITAGVAQAAEVAVVVDRRDRYVTVYQKVCEPVAVERRSQGTGGAVMGAILGAAVGNQIGEGRGRDIATAAGAVIGSQMAAEPGSTVIETHSRCVTQPVSVYDGETVTFEYRGRRFTQVFKN